MPSVDQTPRTVEEERLRQEAALSISRCFPRLLTGSHFINRLIRNGRFLEGQNSIRPGTLFGYHFCLSEQLQHDSGFSNARIHTRLITPSGETNSRRSDWVLQLDLSLSPTPIPHASAIDLTILYSGTVGSPPNYKVVANFVGFLDAEISLMVVSNHGPRVQLDSLPGGGWAMEYPFTGGEVDLEKNHGFSQLLSYTKIPQTSPGQLIFSRFQFTPLGLVIAYGPLSRPSADLRHIVLPDQISFSSITTRR